MHPTQLQIIQAAFELLAQIEKRLDDENSIQPHSAMHDELGGFVSNLSCYLLDNKSHPNQALVDAGFYNHLMGL